MMFVQFLNGLVWCVKPDAFVEGSLFLEDYENFPDPNRIVDHVIQLATGTADGLDHASITYVGGGIVRFRGKVPDVSSSDEIPGMFGYEVMSPEDALHRATLELTLNEQFGLGREEVAHSIASQGKDYPEESVICMAGSHRELRCPADFSNCNYVRVVVSGFEVAHWDTSVQKKDSNMMLGMLMKSAAK